MFTYLALVVSTEKVGSLEYAAEKEEFGAVRRARWFGRS